MELLMENPELAVAIIAAISDVICGMIPDKYCKYVGFARRVLKKVLKK